MLFPYIGGCRRGRVPNPSLYLHLFSGYSRASSSEIAFVPSQTVGVMPWDSNHSTIRLQEGNSRSTCLSDFHSFSRPLPSLHVCSCPTSFRCACWSLDHHDPPVFWCSTIRLLATANVSSVHPLTQSTCTPRGTRQVLPFRNLWQTTLSDTSFRTFYIATLLNVLPSWLP